MKTYKVCIDYKKGPSFELTLVAISENVAKLQAITTAEFSGFKDAVKRIKVTE